MKILCPDHNGLIEVSSKDIADAFKSASKTMVFSCPICQEEVLIKNIQLEHELPLFNLNRSKKEQKNTHSVDA